MINAIIVDDEPAVSNIIQYFIKKDNLPITIVGSAENGAKALDLMKRNDVRLVFLDILMPIMNGFKVMESIPDKDYIIITAYDSFDYAQQALRLGAKDILLKPIEHKQLIQSITRVIGWRFTSNDTLNGILEFINKNYQEKIDLTILSKIFFISPSHISRLFKQYLNTNTISYIHEVRIKNAVELLDEGKYSIKEIAEITGYENLNNFYKYFKIFKGNTPAMYIQGQLKNK
ncbi:MAG: response regulator [Sedimentibacter sp.]|uniref:response regulator transcription factor n=1 Tax=Sedimentibacter sp. TaxID=1960295 RepID=UPI003159086B